MRKGTMLALLTVMGAAVFAGPAWAGGARSFVSGGGTDAGTCERVAPCRTFGYAMTQTNAGGEIVAVDSSGYGPVTIDKSISLTAPRGVHAAISPSSGNAITVSAGVNDDVELRNLALRGSGGGIGIQITEARSVTVADVTARRWGVGLFSTDADGAGLYLLMVRNTFLANDEGVLLNRTAGFTRLSARDLTIVRSTARGLAVSNAGSSGLTGTIAGAEISQNGTTGVDLSNSGNGITSLLVEDATIDNNASGINAAGDPTTVTQLFLGRSRLAHNGILGNVVGNATLFTYGDNAVIGGDPSLIFTPAVRG